MTEINKLRKLSNEYYAIGCQFPDSELNDLCIEVSDMYNMIVEHYNEIALLENKIEKNKESLKGWGIRVNEGKDIH